MDFRGFDDANANAPTNAPADAPADAPATQPAAPAVSSNLQEADLAAASGRDLKLPPFCATDATSWFQHIEIIFRIRQVRNDTSKADHMLAALPEDSFPLLSGWLADQGDMLQYNKLRSKILSLFAPTPETRASRIIQLSKLQVGTQ